MLWEKRYSRHKDEHWKLHENNNIPPMLVVGNMYHNTDTELINP